MTDRKDAAKLFTRYLANQCSADEIRLLLKEFGLTGNESILRAAILRELDNEPAGEHDEAVEQVYDNLLTSIRAQEQTYEKPVIPFYRNNWVRAAVVVIMATAGAYFYFNGIKPEKITVATKHTTPAVKDIPPGTDKAILILGNGTSVILDSNASNILTQQLNGSEVNLRSGELVYNTGGSARQPEPVYHTLSTPRAGRYHVKLPDGTGVWLNAASSITFPTAFTGMERVVNITGEVYFEVASAYQQNSKNKMPFIVRLGNNTAANKAEIHVLGTHFNVMAYEEENSIKTTLLEGSVKIVKDRSSILLLPGQQAGIDKKTEKISVVKTDIEAAIAWKNGLFQFNADDIQTIMREVGRWYNVEIGYAGKIPEGHYSGIVARGSDLSKVLKILEESDLHFKIEGKKLIVL